MKAASRDRMARRRIDAAGDEDRDNERPEHVSADALSHRRVLARFRSCGLSDLANLFHEPAYPCAQALACNHLIIRPKTGLNNSLKFQTSRLAGVSLLFFGACGKFQSEGAAEDAYKLDLGRLTRS